MPNGWDGKSADIIVRRRVLLVEHTKSVILKGCETVRIMIQRWVRFKSEVSFSVLEITKVFVHGVARFGFVRGEI